MLSDNPRELQCRRNSSFYFIKQNLVYFWRSMYFERDFSYSQKKKIQELCTYKKETKTSLLQHKINKIFNMNHLYPRMFANISISISTLFLLLFLISPFFLCINNLMMSQMPTLYFTTHSCACTLMSQKVVETQEEADTQINPIHE